MTTIKEAKEMIDSILETNPERGDHTIMIGVDDIFIFNCFGTDEIVMISQIKTVCYKKYGEIPYEP